MASGNRFEDYVECAESLNSENPEISLEDICKCLNETYDDESFYIHKQEIYLDCSDKGCLNKLVFWKNYVDNNS